MSEASVVNDLKAGRFRISGHAYDQMEARTVSHQDIIEVGRSAYKTETQPNGLIRVYGHDLEDDLLDVICAYDGNTLIVTVY